MQLEPIDPFTAVANAGAALADPELRQGPKPGAATLQREFPGGFIDCNRMLISSAMNGALEQGMSSKFYYCIDGRGRFTTPQGRQPFEAGDLIYFAPGQPHGLAMDAGDRATLLRLHLADYTFERDMFGDRDVCALLDHLHQSAFNGSHLVDMGSSSRNRVDACFRSLDRESHTSYRGRNALIKAEVLRLAAILSSDTRFGEGLEAEVPYATSLGRISRVLNHIRDNFQDRIIVCDMAQLAELSRSHFHAAFRKATGCSLIEYVNRFRLMRAKTDLLRTDKPLAQIAEDYGFGSASRFSTVHKQLFGITPNQARRAFRADHQSESLQAYIDRDLEV